jgi:hypothetical protein
VSLALAEFWFLDTALEMRINLDVLVNPRMAEALNRPGHDHEVIEATSVQVVERSGLV